MTDYHPPPAIIAPAPTAPEQLLQVKRKRHRSSSSSADQRPTTRPRFHPGLVIGMVILLSDGNGGSVPCRVVSIYPEPLCIPEADQ